jgi:hypothetical protein
MAAQKAPKKTLDRSTFGAIACVGTLAYNARPGDR